MKKNSVRRRRFQLWVLCCFMLIAMTGCGKGIPVSYFEECFHNSEDNQLEKRIPVRFYYDNLANIYAIDSSTIYMEGFFSKLFTTNASQFDTMTYTRLRENNGNGRDAYQLDLFNGTLMEEYKKENFYLPSTNENRKEYGILSQVFAQETDEEIFDKNCVSVVFTDLGETGLLQTAETIKNKYLSADYKMVIMSITATLRNNVDFSVAFSNDQVCQRKKYVNEGVASQERNYYLIISGPPIYLATYFNALHANLNATTEVKGQTYQPITYNVSPMYWTQKRFDFTKDIVVDLNQSSQAYQNSDFESSCIRLTQPEWSFIPEQFRDKCLEYRYNEIGKNGYTAKGRINSLDFSFNSLLTIQDYSIPYGFSDIYADNKAVPIINEEELDSNDTVIRFEFDNLHCDFFRNGKQCTFHSDDDYKRKLSRFFKCFEISEGKTLSIISDNTDQSGIDSVIISADVVQIIRYPNRVEKWIETQSWSAEIDKGNPITMTANLKDFYCMLFNLSYVNTPGYTDKFQDNQVVMEPANIGTLRVVVTDL